MMIRTTLIAASIALLSACSQSEPDATGFITPDTPVPASAEQKSGDVPRDDYGRPYSYAFLGEKLPAFSGTMLSGEEFSSDQLEGQWTVIDIWGLWCGDCMADAPYVAALATAISQDPDLTFMSIHTPPNAQRADEAYGKYDSVQSYFNSAGYSYATLLDTNASIRDTLDIAWTPSYLLIAPDGTVQGFRSELSAADGEPVKDFMRDIAEVKKAYEPG